MPTSHLSLLIIHQAWRLARGRCECHREGHGHLSRCTAPVALNDLGRLGKGGWFAVAWMPLAAGGRDTPENVEVLCATCYDRLIREALAA